MLAMALLAAQPAEKGAHHQFCVEPVGLGPAMLARDGDAGRVDHMGFDALPRQPPRQPEAIPAGLVGHRDPIDRAASLGRLVAPAMQQPQQLSLDHGELLQRLAIDAGHDATDQPARLAQLDHSDQRAILIESGERSAQVIRLWHGALRRLSQRRWCLVLAARPIASLISMKRGAGIVGLNARSADR